MPTQRPDPLPQRFFARPTLRVARDLLGMVLVHRTSDGTAAGIVVETEAYIGEEDPACHAAPGPTPRNAPLYGPPGIAYVYLNYGVHHLVNAVTEPAGQPAAVLIRALEPVEGLTLMRRRRANGARSRTEGDLCRGPGNLTRALEITLAENRRDLTRGTLRFEDRGYRIGPIAKGPRVGIQVAVGRPWRFWVRGHPSVSGPRRKRA
jgi:DNA-3-methyladenine glycosylase